MYPVNPGQMGCRGVQFLMIKQKNLIHNEIHIIHYSNLSTFKCSKLKYVDMIITNFTCH